MKRGTPRSWPPCAPPLPLSTTPRRCPGLDDGGNLALEATPVGVGAREVPRRELDDAEVERLVRAGVTERRAAARVCEDAGQPDRAEQLRREADALAAVARLPPGP